MANVIDIADIARQMDAAVDALRSLFGNRYQKHMEPCIQVLESRMERTGEMPLTAAINIARLPGMGGIARLSYLAAGIEFVTR